MKPGVTLGARRGGYRPDRSTLWASRSVQHRRPPLHSSLSLFFNLLLTPRLSTFSTVCSSSISHRSQPRVRIPAFALSARLPPTSPLRYFPAPDLEICCLRTQLPSRSSGYPPATVFDLRLSSFYFPRNTNRANTFKMSSPKRRIETDVSTPPATDRPMSWQVD